MTLRTILLAFAWSFSAASGFALELKDLPDSELTPDQWQNRVGEARRRSEEFVANARTPSATSTVSEEELGKESSRRAMNDPSLQRGDIISTSQGLVIFVGRDGEERQPSDFVPAPHLPH
jgi:hypothetical protein